MSLKPNAVVPALTLPTVGGGTFDLRAGQPTAFTMLVVYRGLHCPICKTYLRDLDQKLGEFSALGVDAVAVTTDSKDRAEQARKEWGIENLPIAHDLSIDQARGWGLYISAAIKETEPALFAEPGLFLVRPDGTLYAASLQTMPFARPQFAEILGAVKYITNNNYPARGEV
ncbi:MAG: peroxiredoxin-like family protein [Nitrospiraceae bacterium]